MKKYLAAALLLLALPAYAAQPFSRIEHYVETTKGKTSVCGINFYIATDAVKNKPIAGYYGSVFIQPTPDGRMGTAIRINEFQDGDQLVTLDWANLKLKDVNGKPFDTSHFTHVDNPADPKGYSAITYDPDAGNILAYLATGGTLQIKRADSPADDNVPLSGPVDTKAYILETIKCLAELQAP